jgi:hypothetical protein
VSLKLTLGYGPELFPLEKSKRSLNPVRPVEAVNEDLAKIFIGFLLDISILPIFHVPPIAL